MCNCTLLGLFGTANFSFSSRIPIDRLFGDMFEIPTECVTNTVPVATLDLLVNLRFTAALHEIFVGDSLGLVNIENLAQTAVSMINKIPVKHS